MKYATTFMGAAAAAAMLATGATAATLDDVKSRGELVCGVSTGLPGFSNPKGRC